MPASEDPRRAQDLARPQPRSFLLWNARTHAAEPPARAMGGSAEIQERDRLRDQVFASIAHDVRTPLSLILGYAELLEEEHPESELLEGLRLAVQRLDRQLTDGLDCAALFSGGSPLHLEPTELADVLAFVTADREAAFAERGVRLVLDVPDDLPPVHGDGHRLGQLVVALLDHALKFTPAGGQVDVHVARAPGGLAIGVRDTGPGLPPATRARLLQAFGQADAADAAGAGRVGGPGLGMAIAAKVAELHGGRIALTSGPDAGAAFTVFLPLPDGPA